jgi:urease accessory protein
MRAAAGPAGVPVFQRVDPDEREESVSIRATVNPRWRGATLAGGLGASVFPSTANAHLVTTGLGPVYDGLLHFAVSPEDLGPTLALALLAGLHGAAHGRRALFVLPAVWFSAGALGLAVGGGASPVLTALSFVLLGALVAVDLRVSLRVTTALAALLGLLHGYLNGTAMARPGLGPLAMVGIAAAVFTLVALATSLIVPLRAAWTGMVIRVAGSWIAAIGMLLLGWALRPGA